MSTPVAGGTTSTAVNEVTYTAQEYSYTGPDTLPAGWTKFTLDNQGQLSHELQVLKLETGKTLADVTAALTGPGMPDWVEAYGSVTAEGGKTASFTTELTPGNYVLLSFGSANNAPPDAAQGMLKVVTVSAATGTATGMGTLPTPDITVDLVDFRFVVTGTITSGTHVVQVMNTGTEPHELVAMRLKEGKTIEDFRKALDVQMSGQAVADSDDPVASANSIALSPGRMAYAEMKFEAGEYVFICFIPSERNAGRPHYDLGMIESVTVQ